MGGQCICREQKKFSSSRSLEATAPIAATNPDLEPEDPRNVIAVHVRQMRDKIRPFGLKVICHFGWGKELEGDIHINWRRSPLFPASPFVLPSGPYQELRA